MFRTEASRQAHANDVPAHWELLTEDDQKAYMNLRKFIGPLTIRTKNDRLPMNFRVILQTINMYIVRNDDDDWKRAMCCGIAWVANGIAISTRQLHKLIGKCKSSINAGFLSLGYGTVPTSAEHATSLLKIFPFMIGNAVEMRQWTIRGPIAQTENVEESVHESENVVTSPEETEVVQQTPKEPEDLADSRSYDDTFRNEMMLLEEETDTLYDDGFFNCTNY